MQHNCIKLKCYITLEKDKDAKKKRNDSISSQITPPPTPTGVPNQDSLLDNFSPISPYPKSRQERSNSLHSTPVNNNGGGAKKVNVEVIMKSNPFRVGKKDSFQATVDATVRFKVFCYYITLNSQRRMRKQHEWS